MSRAELKELDEYFFGKSKRTGAFFCRLDGCDTSAEGFVRRYLQAARTNGLVLERGLQNPDEKKISYYNEIMGSSFDMSEMFITKAVRKWLPRLTLTQTNAVVKSIVTCLTSLRQSGKNDNMIKNAYIKVMCWLYYSLEQVIAKTENKEEFPKLLYCTAPGNYQLMMLGFLADLGADILIINYRESDYLKADPTGRDSQHLYVGADNGGTFDLDRLRREIEEEQRQSRLFGDLPKDRSCTNAWISGELFDDIRRPAAVRNDGSFPADRFFNIYARMNGVLNRSEYANELYRLFTELKNAGRRILVLDSPPPPPGVDEVSKIRRQNVRNCTEMLGLLLKNTDNIPDKNLRDIVKRAYHDVMTDTAEYRENKLSKFTQKAVILLCFLFRYQKQLFDGYRFPEVSVFFRMGNITENEELFVKLLSRLPVDILIFNPALEPAGFTDDNLYERSFTQALEMKSFPTENTSRTLATEAYHAERDLDRTLYTDTGLYRDYQYSRSVTVTLKTMYEELYTLWDEETKFRPGFSVIDGAVNVPAIFCKISGVKDKNTEEYWLAIKKLLTPDAKLITKTPFLNFDSIGEMLRNSRDFIVNGRLARERIKAHRQYQYGYLAENVQENILDKLDELLRTRPIKGMFDCGVEYSCVAVALSLEKDILRRIQSFDYTRKNPKLVFVLTGEYVFCTEDVIFLAYLNMLGFDIAIFVPTGYDVFGGHLNTPLCEEHRIGEYMYDLRIPNFHNVKENPFKKLKDIFNKPL